MGVNRSNADRYIDGYNTPDSLCEVIISFDTGHIVASEDSLIRRKYVLHYQLPASLTLEAWEAPVVALVAHWGGIFVSLFSFLQHRPF